MDNTENNTHVFVYNNSDTKIEYYINDENNTFILNPKQSNILSSTSFFLKNTNIKKVLDETTGVFIMEIDFLKKIIYYKLFN
jgi:hypothetical protein